MRKTLLVSLLLLCLVLVAVLLGFHSSPAVSSKCVGTQSSVRLNESTTTLTESSGYSTSVGSTEINGTFYGWLTAPMTVFDKAQKLLENTNATLYEFKVEVIGKKLNASITLFLLKLSPPFVPKDFNVTVNGKLLTGSVFVPYSDPIPVSIELREGKGSVNTTSYLKVRPTQVKQTMGVWDEEKLNALNGTVILKLDEVGLRVTVGKPGDYLFSAIINGTENPLGALTVG
ncbi:hypothetical protein [Thermococcus sp.]